MLYFVYHRLLTTFRLNQFVNFTVQNLHFTIIYNMIMLLLGKTLKKKGIDMVGVIWVTCILKKKIIRLPLETKSILKNRSRILGFIKSI